MKKPIFNTKNLIVDAVKSKLKEENIEKMLLNFSLHSDNYTVHLKPVDLDKPIKYHIEPKDTTMIKRLFVTKLKYKIKEIEKYQHIILSIDTNKNDFELFLRDKKDTVTKFEI